MKIIVSGLGKTGRTFVEILTAERHSVTVIDIDKTAAENAEREYGVTAVIGNAALSDVLAAAEAGLSDLYIAASGSDELNLLSCLSAKRMGVKRTVCVSRTHDFIKEMPYLTTLCGIDYIFNPELETANGIYRSLRMPAAVNVMSFAGGRAELARVEVTNGAEIVGKTLAAIRASTKLNVLVCAVNRGGKVAIPDGSFEIAAGDDVYITGPHADLYAFLKVMGMQSSKIKNVLIAGGSNVALFLASMLENTSVSVKMIEKSKSRCDVLKGYLDKTKVVCGDTFDSELLVKEGLAKADCCLALSDSDEENVIVSMYAKENGSGKIISKVAKKPLRAMLPDMGAVSSVVSAQKTISNIALSYIRALEETKDSAVGTVCKIADGGAEMTEFHVKTGFEKAGVPLMRLDIRQGVLITGIIRGNELLYPNGSTAICEGDTVIVVNSGKSLKKLSDIFK